MTDPGFWILIQLTTLLFCSLLAAWLIKRSACRAHFVLVASLILVFLLPFFTLVVATNDLGVFAAKPRPLGYSQQALAGVPDLDSVMAWQPLESRPYDPVLFESNFAAATTPTTNENTRGQWSWPTWSRSLIVIWIALSLLFSWKMFVGVLKSKRILSSGRPVSDPVLLEQFEQARHDLSIAKSVGLESSDQIGCPMIWCWKRPRLMIPHDYWKKQSTDWRGVFCHELAHLKRRDNLWDLLSQFVRCVLPWHPFVYALDRWMKQLSERACDNWAIHTGSQPDQFAESILNFVPTKQTLLFSPMASRGGNVMNRVENLLCENIEIRPNLGGRWIAFTAVGMTFAVMIISVAQPGAGSNVAWASVNQEQQEQENEQWIDRLKAAPDGSRWYVGANFGRQLSALPENQAFEILSACWGEIADSVRPQILKGFTPGFKKTDGINEGIFEVLHLGYNDPDETVRKFARSYINQLTFSLDANDKDAYEQWRKSNEGKKAEEIIIGEAKAFAARLSELKGGDILEAVAQIGDASNDMREFHAMREAAVEAGMIDALRTWVDEGKISAQDSQVQQIASNIMKSTESTETDDDPPTRTVEVANDPEFEGFTLKEAYAGGNKKMRYFLSTRDGEAGRAEEEGLKLLLILPGGDGSEDFQAWCRRIHKNAAPRGYAMAQLIAPVWSKDENRVVWPTKKLNPDDASFTTEQFISEVVKDIGKHVTINDRYVFTLGWSSGGPPLYSAALQPKTPVTGTFVAMSVFKPQLLPKLSAAKGHAFYLLHSPQDWIKIDQHARVAEKQLGNAGASVKLQTYSGGHGWRDDPFGNIRSGLDWLEKNANKNIP